MGPTVTGRGFLFVIAVGLVCILFGLPVAANWRGLGRRAYQLYLPVLPRWYRHDDMIRFRIWIGGATAVLGLVVVLVGVAGLIGWLHPIAAQAPSQP